MITRYMAGFLLVVALGGCNSDKTASDTALSTATPVSVTLPASQSTPPSISGSPSLTATSGAAYSFKPTAMDADGDPLTFSIRNKPVWANFDTATGTLTGTPSVSNVGNFAGIVIGVSDGAATASLATFSIAVNAPGQKAPSISGNPSKSVLVGTPYSFTPAASDPGGLALTFSIANKPVWAGFNDTTGELRGTPGASDVGTASGITISVSDGAKTASLPAFSIAVNQSASGSATLSWMPPATNTDGSALTNLAGYRIYYGTNSSALNTSIQVTNPGVSAYVISNLSPATWYFSVRAYNSANVESNFSSQVSKKVL